MYNSCDVLFAVTGDATRNSRALRQVRALAGAGYSVRVLSLSGPHEDPLPSGVSVDAFPTPHGRGPRFFRALHEAFRERSANVRAAVYHASDLFCLPAVARASRIHGGRLIYDSRELYTALGAAHRRPWARAVWYLVERRYIRRADVVLTVNEPIADALQALYHIRRPVVLPNVPAMRRTSPSGRLRAMARIADGAALVLYQGYLKAGRGCLIAVDAIRDLPHATLVLLGEGALAPEIERRAARNRMQDRVVILPMVHPDELLSLTADADVGLCLIEDLSRSLRLSLPNKLFEYAAAGVPILGSDLPEIRRLVCGFEVGLLARPGDVGNTRDVLHEMLRDAERRKRWSENTHRLASAYDPVLIEHRFLEAYRQLCLPGA